MSNAAITFGKFIGDSECKEADVFVNGVKVGFIAKWNTDEFIGSSRRRTWTFSFVELNLRGRDDSGCEWHAPEFTSKEATKAAKKRAVELLSSEG